eukprot:10282154-Alexandrium_andersonii.AAC.1
MAPRRRASVLRWDLPSPGRSLLPDGTGGGFFSAARGRPGSSGWARAFWSASPRVAASSRPGFRWALTSALL